MAEAHPAKTLMDLSTAYWSSRCLHVVAEAGIADALADEPQTAATLAAATGTNADALHRILRALANHGIFTLRDGRFSHNAASRLLRSDAPGSMRPLARMMGLDIHWDVFRDIAYSLKTGRSAADAVVPGGLFARLREHPEEGRIFNEAMVAKSFGQIGRLLAGYDFQGFGTIGDIGGGLGHLLAAILETVPQARGVLFDLPEVIAQAPTHPRIDCVAGDFFAGPIPACDLYVMMTVIHDWSDEESIRILKNVRAAAPSGARLLLVESIIDEGATGSFAIDLDIEMLVFASGRERTEPQWRALLQAAGFRMTRASAEAGFVEAELA